jgi:hypothetical protein
MFNQILQSLGILPKQTQLVSPQPEQTNKVRLEQFMNQGGINPIASQGLKQIQQPMVQPTPTPTPQIDYQARNPSYPDFNVSDVVKQAIIEASQKNQIPPELLLDIALQESSFNPEKQNPGSSAGGLFQFTDPTWNDMQRWGAIPQNADKFNPETNAQAAAWAIANGLLEKWNASKDVWGEHYNPEELQQYYNPFNQRLGYQGVKGGVVNYAR